MKGIQFLFISSDKIRVICKLTQVCLSDFGGVVLENLDSRKIKDRREQPTPGLSRYSFWGRRRTLRRKTDREKGGYVDWYGPGLFFLLLLTVALNILDALCTMLILDLGAWELNPLVRSAIGLYGDKFWIWKFAIVSICLVILCIHIKFKPIKAVIVTISSVYIGIVLYEISLILYHLKTPP
jgi:hypothetical protein